MFLYALEKWTGTPDGSQMQFLSSKITCLMDRACWMYLLFRAFLTLFSSNELTMTAYFFFFCREFSAPVKHLFAVTELKSFDSWTRQKRQEKVCCDWLLWSGRQHCPVTCWRRRPLLALFADSWKTGRERWSCFSCCLRMLSTPPFILAACLPPKNLFQRMGLAYLIILSNYATWSKKNGSLSVWFPFQNGYSGSDQEVCGKLVQYVYM